jgi:hypothetical protein
MGYAGTRHQTTTTGWVGWIWFAALVMIMSGAFNVIDGFVALFNNKVYVESGDGLVVFNFTAWGVILLVLGGLHIVVGLALMGGYQWARVVAIILVLISAISQIAFITAYPFWSLLVIFLSLLVLWALAVHGDEMEDMRNP